MRKFKKPCAFSCPSCRRSSKRKEALVDDYGPSQCQEIQFSHWGKSFRFTNPEAFAEFRAFEVDERSGLKCRTLTGKLSEWAVESILKHNSGFSRRED